MEFKILQCLTKFAGILSVIQSLIWIGFSIISIISYYCFLNFKDVKINLSTITRLTFFELYIHGDCYQEGFPSNASFLKYFTLAKSKTTLNSTQFFYGLWLYLVLSTLWLFSSVFLITRFNEKHLRCSTISLYIWIFITLSISVLDIGGSVIFGLDFNEFLKIANSVVDFESTNLYAVVIYSAMTSSIFLLIMSLRGIILWILNVYFSIYFLAKTFAINNDASKDSSSDTHSILRRHPIKAYETDGSSSNMRHTVQLNTEALQRAYKMSIESLQERHRGGYSNPNFNRSDECSSSLPDPDYTPPMPRAFQNNVRHQVLKNKRFE